MKSQVATLEWLRANRARMLRRLESNSAFDPGTGCREWTSRTISGYGKLNIRLEGKHTSHRAHRLAYQLFYGAIPEGHDIDHRCRNKACIEPTHLLARPWHEHRIEALDDGWAQMFNGECRDDFDDPDKDIPFPYSRCEDAEAPCPF